MNGMGGDGKSAHKMLCIGATSATRLRALHWQFHSLQLEQATEMSTALENGLSELVQFRYNTAWFQR